MKTLILPLLMLSATLSSLTANAKAPEKSSILTSEYRLSESLDVGRAPSLFQEQRASFLVLAIKQDPPATPIVWPIMDVAFSTSGRTFEVNRFEQRFKDYGNGLHASLYTGTGWAIDNGAPLISPIGLSFGGEVDLGLMILVGSFGADLLFVQNEKPTMMGYGRLGFRVPTG